MRSQNGFQKEYQKKKYLEKKLKKVFENSFEEIVIQNTIISWVCKKRRSNDSNSQNFQKGFKKYKYRTIVKLENRLFK